VNCVVSKMTVTGCVASGSVRPSTTYRWPASASCAAVTVSVRGTIVTPSRRRFAKWLLRYGRRNFTTLKGQHVGARRCRVSSRVARHRRCAPGCCRRGQAGRQRRSSRGTTAHPRRRTRRSHRGRPGRQQGRSRQGVVHDRRLPHGPGMWTPSLVADPDPMRITSPQRRLRRPPEGQTHPPPGHRRRPCHPA